MAERFVLILEWNFSNLNDLLVCPNLGILLYQNAPTTDYPAEWITLLIQPKPSNGRSTNPHTTGARVRYLSSKVVITTYWDIPIYTNVVLVVLDYI